MQEQLQESKKRKKEKNEDTPLPPLQTPTTPPESTPERHCAESRERDATAAIQNLKKYSCYLPPFSLVYHGCRETSRATARVARHSFPTFPTKISRHIRIPHSSTWETSPVILQAAAKDRHLRHA